MKFPVRNAASPYGFTEEEATPLPPDADLETLARGSYDTGERKHMKSYLPVTDEFVTGEHGLFVLIRGVGHLPKGVVEAYVRRNLDRVIKMWMLTDESIQLEPGERQRANSPCCTRNA